MDVHCQHQYLDPPFRLNLWWVVHIEENTFMVHSLKFCSILQTCTQLVLKHMNDSENTWSPNEKPTFTGLLLKMLQAKNFPRNNHTKSIHLEFCWLLQVSIMHECISWNMWTRIRSSCTRFQTDLKTTLQRQEPAAMIYLTVSKTSLKQIYFQGWMWMTRPKCSIPLLKSGFLPYSCLWIQCSQQDT